MKDIEIEISETYAENQGALKLYDFLTKFDNALAKIIVDEAKVCANKASNGKFNLTDGTYAMKRITVYDDFIVVRLMRFAEGMAVKLGARGRIKSVHNELQFHSARIDFSLECDDFGNLTKWKYDEDASFVSIYGHESSWSGGCEQGLAVAENL